MNCKPETRTVAGIVAGNQGASPGVPSWQR